MNLMNPADEELKADLNRWKAVEAVQRNERREATYGLRWRQLNAIHNLARGLGLKIQKNEAEEMEIILRWSKIRNFYGKR